MPQLVKAWLTFARKSQQRNNIKFQLFILSNRKNIVSSLFGMRLMTQRPSIPFAREAQHTQFLSAQQLDPSHCSNARSIPCLSISP
ncbi:hypothetical protein VTL71DRAFT_5407 [Oculimacula yallundae]|uniref:Uncharacterized protein n=1 Tax=Oculimacula yallundae TaxID=86028 RepID=A0ABR4C222_9HELO